MAGDFGGANDGQCEYSFLSRCPDTAVITLTYGQQSGWTYNYCGKHGLMMQRQKQEDEEWERNHAQ